MSNAKGILLALGGFGAVVLIARAASAGTSAKPKTQQTYVEQMTAQAKAKATGKGSLVDKGKTYATKGTKEAQSALDKINALLK